MSTEFQCISGSIDSKTVNLIIAQFDLPPAKEKIATYKSFIETVKWAKMSNFIKQLAYNLQLEVNVTVDKGWIMETTYFSVTGPENIVREFNDQLWPLYIIGEINE